MGCAQHASLLAGSVQRFGDASFQHAELLLSMGGEGEWSAATEGVGLLEALVGRHPAGSAWRHACLLRARIRGQTMNSSDHFADRMRLAFAHFPAIAAFFVPAMPYMVRFADRG